VPHSDFEPSGARGAALDLRMRERLADSLAYVFEQVSEPLGIEAAAASALVADIRERPQSPQRFGAYYDLVFALDRGEWAEARSFAAELLSPRQPPEFRIAAIQDRPAAEAERSSRLFLDDGRRAAPIAADLLDESRTRIADALDLLEAGFPALHEEIRALIRDIVIAVDSGERGFGGASSFMMWGGLLLNARRQRTILETAQALAHESGHNLLFGFCADGPLVRNPDDALFTSPLRADPRPMDGIVHATYVVARMHQTMSRLLDSGVLDRKQADAARDHLRLHAESFDGGDREIRQFADLTPIGEKVTEAARAYMANATGN
jgi:HEXXH motif-containing protein